MIKDTNKRMVVVISKDDFERLSAAAKSECRSVSKQALLFILKGLELKEKRD
jgi:hypothetical protein